MINFQTLEEDIASGKVQQILKTGGEPATEIEAAKAALGNEDIIRTQIKFHAIAKRYSDSSGEEIEPVIVEVMSGPQLDECIDRTEKELAGLKAMRELQTNLLK
jgi:hypothetical protein